MTNSAGVSYPPLPRSGRGNRRDASIAKVPVSDDLPDQPAAVGHASLHQRFLHADKGAFAVGPAPVYANGIGSMNGSGRQQCHRACKKQERREASGDADGGSVHEVLANIVPDKNRERRLTGKGRED